MHAVLGRIENYNSQRRITFALVSFKAGAAVTAGTVLAILPFSRLTIRVGGHVAMLIVVTGTCMQFEKASCSCFIVQELPLTPHQPSARFVFQ